MRGLASEHLACPWGTVVFSSDSQCPLRALASPHQPGFITVHAPRLCEPFNAGRRDLLEPVHFTAFCHRLSQIYFLEPGAPSASSISRYGGCHLVKESIQVSDIPAFRRHSCPSGSDWPSLICVIRPYRPTILPLCTEMREQGDFCSMWGSVGKKKL